MTEPHPTMPSPTNQLPGPQQEFTGALLVDKPAHMTSFGVVARVRRLLSQQAGRRIKVGHTGTLDPFATGLMVVVTGKMTKQAETFTKLDKVYEATIMLGAESSTGDPEGEITQVAGEQPTRAALEAALAQFTGAIQQQPPVFSAIKIDGRRAYDRARKGEAVEMPMRTVHVYELTLLDYTYPAVVVRAHVGSGTYIRSLAVDIGKALGTGAYCTELRRTKVGRWDVTQAATLDELGVDS